MINPPRRITSLLRRANGSSEPWFCLLDDQSIWLVKFVGAGPGPSALLAELVANSLGRLWGLPIPQAEPVVLDATVPRAGTDEFWDVLDASRGLNLGIKLIPDATDTIPSSEAFGPRLSALVAFDTLMENWDRTELSRNLLKDANDKLWWIDHGSCRFLHNLETLSRPALPSNHFMAGQKLSDPGAPFTLPALSSEAVHALIAESPGPWSQNHGSASKLADKLVRYIHAGTNGGHNR